MRGLIEVRLEKRGPAAWRLPRAGFIPACRGFRYLAASRLMTLFSFHHQHVRMSFPISAFECLSNANYGSAAFPQYFHFAQTFAATVASCCLSPQLREPSSITGLASCITDSAAGCIVDILHALLQDDGGKLPTSAVDSTQPDTFPLALPSQWFRSPKLRAFCSWPGI